MSTKPFFITSLDYKLLKEKYPENELEKIVEKINNGYPVQYAIGNVEFLDSIINVDERVLIPRFETELLVDKLLKIINKKDNISILDLCTGSGCIAISLKKNLPLSTVTAVDLSNFALEVARSNAKINNVKINFMKKDVLKKLNFNKKFDLIVSNPPYVSLNENVDIQTKFEPQIALYPGEDELLFYKKIIENSKDIISENGLIAFEIGAKQAKEITDISMENYPNSTVTVEKDLNGFDRYLFISINKNI